MAYAPIVLPADLANKAYQEIIDTVTRDTPAIASEAIDTAIAQAKMYLSRYDLIKLFGDKDNDIGASFTDIWLTNAIKDMALWQLFSLANPNISLELARTRYKDALDELKNIQSGKSDPKWPYVDTTGEAAPQGNAIYSNSNPKRSQHF